MDKKTMQKASARKAVGRPKVVGLPFYFKQIETFLNEAEVPVSMMSDLLKARNAMGKALLLIYGFESSQVCLDDLPLFPPI